jgi:hypothetical protein
MKHFLALLLGAGAISGVACQSHAHRPETYAEQVTISLTGVR